MHPQRRGQQGAALCALEAPNAARLEEMRQECVTDWMTKMSQPRACVQHFSGVASGGCSAAELRDACEEVSAKFRVRDAEKLCEGLQQAHQAFWPSFWASQT